MTAILRKSKILLSSKKGIHTITKKQIINSLFKEFDKEKEIIKDDFISAMSRMCFVKDGYALIIKLEKIS